MLNSSRTKNSTVAFFALTFLFSVPFYILNALAYLHIFGEPEMGAMYIALFTFTPIASALILTSREHGSQGPKKLLSRIFDFKRITKSLWYLVILFLSPLIYMVSITILVLSSAQFPPAMSPLISLPAVFLFFFILAAGEEVGWMGYVFEPLQEGIGSLKAALVLGVIWSLWHIPFLVFMLEDLVVLIMQIIMLIGARILIVWIFNNTGKSVFAAILFHAADNTSLVIFPEIKAIIPWGSVLLCSIILTTAAAVTVTWGSKSVKHTG